MYHRRLTLLARWTIHALKAPKGKKNHIRRRSHSLLIERPSFGPTLGACVGP